MSFPHSRTNIQKTNPYSFMNPADLRQGRPNHKNRISPNAGCMMATEIPYHDMTTTPSSYEPSHPCRISQFNPVICGYTMPCSQKYMNSKLGNSTVRELLTRNKSISNPYNSYPFYDDPSVMWSTPNNYYNPMA